MTENDEETETVDFELKDKEIAFESDIVDNMMDTVIEEGDEEYTLGEYVKTQIMTVPPINSGSYFGSSIFESYNRESDRFESVELVMGGTLEIGIIDNNEVDETLDEIDAEELARELDDI